MSIPQISPTNFEQRTSKVSFRIPKIAMRMKILRDILQQSHGQCEAKKGTTAYKDNVFNN